MSRTPSLTIAEAEAALGRGRGHLYVNSENIGIARKWLTAKGLSGAFAATLRQVDVAVAYNDATDEKFNALKVREAQWAANNQAVVGTPNTATVVAPSNDSQVQRIAALLGELLSKPVIDADAVNALIDQRWESLPDLIAKYSPVTTIQVNNVAAGTTTTVQGHTHKLFPKIMALVNRNIAVMLVGPAGSGKSHIGSQIAEALGLAFYFQPAASGSHEYLGHVIGDHYRTTAFRQAYEFGGVFVAEELDGGHADVPLVLNAALANGHCYFPDSVTPVARHPNFRIIANANTYGTGPDRIYVGRTQLDGATRDRFWFETFDYDTVLERALTGNDAWVDRVQEIRRKVQPADRIVVSPRASIQGAKMLADGFTMADCEEGLIWKGTAKETRARIMAR